MSLLYSVLAFPRRVRLAIRFALHAVEARKQLELPGMIEALKSSGVLIEHRTLLTTVVGAVR